MGVSLAVGNVVLTAEQFNPTIISQIWLARIGLVPEDGFRDGCIFSPHVAQVRTREFELLVIPQLAQFVPSVEQGQQQRVIVDKLGLLVERLPETPYRALGFNITWHLQPEKSSIEEFTRRLFRVPDGPVHKFFDDTKDRFGSYLSKDSLGFRLKLMALPVVVPSPEQQRHLVAFNFNYHFDISDQGDSVTSIVSMLPRWDEAVAESSQIVQAAGS